MGGSSEGIGPRGRIGGGDNDFDCGTYKDTTTVVSPNKSELDKVTVGDQLEVHAIEEQIKVFIPRSTEPVGSVIPSAFDNLLNCIENGTDYAAEVKSKLGGSCVVHIHAVVSDD